jgi:leucyl aminopeptidase (aminopeptidase T)
MVSIWQHVFLPEDMEGKMVNKEDLKTAVEKIIRVNMGIKEAESILIVNDIPDIGEWHKPLNSVKDVVNRSILAREFYEIAAEEFARHKTNYLTYYTLGRHSAELPDEIQKALGYYDVIIGITTYSLSHTAARETACRKGARVASLPRIIPEMFLEDGPLNVDYDDLKDKTLRICRVLSEGSRVMIKSPNGTELYLNLDGRTASADTGLIREKGQWGNLPGGEACIAPVEGTTFGKLAVSAGWYPGLKEDMILIFEEGEVVDIQGGGSVGDYFRNTLGLGSQDLKLRRRRNCAEFGIGTNPNARRPDNVLEAEKIKGTVHIAVGDSSHIGGIISADIHEDFVVDKPDVYIDDICILKSGKFFWEV